jgi:hypothetical protein
VEFSTFCLNNERQLQRTRQDIDNKFFSGVIFTDGPLWVEHRRFTIRNLKDFGFGKKDAEGIILEETEELMKEIKEKKIIQVSH